MEAPQITMVGIMIFCVTFALCNHGRERSPIWNAWFTIGDVVILAAILRWGGFF